MYVYSHATESYAGIAGFQPVAILTLHYRMETSLDLGLTSLGYCI